MAIAEKHFRPISKSQKLKPFVLRYGHFVDLNRNVVDEITAVYMPAGKSYTGIDQVELFCHGGSQVVQSILRQLLDSGARAAEPGEFTRLAFLSGRLDLTKAEAVAEIIAANTQSSLEVAREHLLGAYGREVDMLRDGMVEVLAQVEASTDFPEEEISPAESRRLLDLVEKCIDGLTALAESYTGGKIIREGYRVAIGGRPNAGKSSLFNLLLKQERALVTPTAGTTRDYLSEWIDLEGFAVNLVDTAGLRPGGSADLDERRVAAQVGIDAKNRSCRSCKNREVVIRQQDRSCFGWFSARCRNIRPVRPPRLLPYRGRNQ